VREEFEDTKVPQDITGSHKSTVNNTTIVNQRKKDEDKHNS
jgi:hypothetical protein